MVEQSLTNRDGITVQGHLRQHSLVTYSGKQQSGRGNLSCSERNELTSALRLWTAIQTVVKVVETQRRYRRFKLAAPVAFKWWESDGLAREGVGYSRDISAGGIFIRAAHCTPSIRSVLRYEVLLPSPSTTGAFVRIKAAGRVLRTKSPNDGKKYHEFAVQSRKALFCLA